MANTDKDILITPNSGSSSADPKIEYVGADSSGSDTITVEALYDGTKATLSFEGSAGQLFSVVNDLTSDPIFSVNDISGVPSIEVDSDGEIRLAEFSGNVGIGNGSPSQKLDVTGNIVASGTVTATGGNSTNWNTAHGWGNHASQSYATQSYVGTQISNLVDSSPSTLNTLNELAAALGDDANFSTTVTNSIATKLPLAGGTLTGGLIGTTATFSSLDVDGIIDNTYNNGNVSAPNNSDHTAGTRIKFYDSSTTSWYAMGIEGNTLWFNSDQNYKFYRQSALKVDFDSAGVVNAVGGYKVNGVLKSGNWDTAYGWGNHASAGYLTSFDITTQTDSKYLRANASDTFGNNTLTIQGSVRSTNNANTSGPNFNVSTTNKSTSEYAYRVDRSGSAVGGIRIDGRLIAPNATIGSVTFGSTQINNWNTAYGWGNHASAGYFSAGNKPAVADITGLIEGTSFNGTYPIVFNIGGANRLFSEDSITFKGSTNTLNINGNTAWHAGNDGSGSGLDADTVDGYHAGDIVLDMGTARIANMNSLGSQSAKYSWNNVTTGRPAASQSNEYGALLHLDYDGGSAYQQAWDIAQSNLYVRTLNYSTDSGSWHKVYHSGNDGSGSGLDADLLDGQHGSYYYSAGNPPPADTNTTYLLKAQQTDGTNADPNLFLDASSGTDDAIKLVGSGATTVTRDNDGQITISSTDTNTDTNTVTRLREDTGAYRTGDLTLQSGTNVTITEPSTGVFNIASTDTNTDTTYSAGTGITLSGTEFSLTDTYLRKDYKENWTRVGYGYIGGVAGAYWHKLASVTINGAYKDYLLKCDWTSRYTYGELSILIHSDNDSTADIKHATIRQLNTNNRKSIQHFKYYKSGSDVEVWVRTDAWHEFDYIRKDAVTEGGPSITWYTIDTTTSQSSEPSSLTTFTEHTPWSPANDGSGSGLDADLLDGQHGSHYLNYNNLTNKPSIPSLSGYATESYVGTQISNLVDSSPSTLNTLNELAAALGDDANFSTTVTNSIATKLPLAGGTMTGKISMFQNNDIFGLSGTIANYPRLSFYSSEGTHAAKTQTLSGDLIGQIDFNPHTGSSYTGGGKISFISTEAITSSQRGTEARIYSTKTGQSSLSYHQFKDDNLYIKNVGGATHKYWHAGNDGGGSGLDADKLDGQQGSYYYSAANPPPTYSKYLRSDTSDTMSGNLSLHGNLLLTGTATTTNQSRMIDFTGFDKEGTTDPSDRAYISHTINTGGHAGSVLVISSQNDSNDGIAFATNSSSQLKHNSNTIWTAGNDGSGSGLDADKLDGQQGSYYLDYNNFTNKPTTIAGTDIDQIYTAAKTLTITTSFADTGIDASDLATGTYLVQLQCNDHAVGGAYSMIYSGTMSWANNNTNDTAVDEIPLHRAGHASVGKNLFLRVQYTVASDVNNLKLQIRGNYAATGSSTYTFKFRRMI